jgi:diadenosine tetraphosphate (Ap4A) HIT family hydrolase
LLTIMSATESPFLAVPVCEWLCSNELAFAVFDGFPVSPGHVLVVTRRMVATWFDATDEEQAALMGLVNEAKRRLDVRLEPKPDGYNVGFNCGAASGQTVPHVHIHVIPRYVGDMADPRGGVRHVIPGKGNYLLGESQKATKLPALTLATGHPTAPLWRSIGQRVSAAAEIDLLASFIQPSGLGLIQQSVFAALRAEAIGVADRTVERAIWRLEQNGRVRGVGPVRGGSWEVTP